MSDWNERGTTPAIAGDYETEDGGLLCFQHWNGEFWGYCANTPGEATAKADLRSHFQQVKWRRLAEQSER